MPKSSKDREGAAGLDALYASDEFRMYCFKVLPCSKHYSHDWTVCPFAHPGEKARRRDPRVFRYAGVECPHVKEGLKCPRGDLCPFAHNIFECWLHPTRYRTQLCNEPASCRRKVCFFAHTLEELREPSNPLDPIAKEDISKGSRLSLDSGASTPFHLTPTPCQSRRSVDFPVSPQPPATPVQVASAVNNVQLPSDLPDAINNLNKANGTKLSMDDLAALLQQLTVSMGSQHIPQNERIVQLLLMLLREIATAGNRTDCQGLDAAGGMAPMALPRISIDNHGLTRGTGMNFSFASSDGAQWGGDGSSMLVNHASIPEHNVLKDQVSRVSVDGLMNPYSSGANARGPSIDAVGAAAAAEAISMGFHGAGRVSVDGSLLSEAAEVTELKSNALTPGLTISDCTGLGSIRAGRPATGVPYSGSILAGGRVAPGVVMNILDGDGALRTSSDSMESDETDLRRQSTDANLADVFILH